MSAGLIQLLFALGSFDINSFSNLYQKATSISDSRSSYSTGYLVIFPLCSACAGVAIFGKNGHGFLARVALFGVFLVCALAITIVTASKGFILALILLILFIYIRLIFWRGGRLAAALLFVVAMIAGFAFLSESPFLETLLHSYSLEESGNEIRAEQARELLSDLSPVGNGLGAKVSSGYARDENGFGFELTYLNLLHKLGVFVFPIFALYAITFIFVLSKAWNNPNKVPPMLALGCLGYLIVGVGNPVLLAPSCVVMHCIAMYLCVSKDSA